MVDGFEPVQPTLDLIARFRVVLGHPLELGQTQWGRRRVIPIKGGDFDGPLLSGTVVPGGADWQVVHDDGMATIDTRYTVQSNDGALISVVTAGVRDGSPQVLQRLARGEPVDPASYYFRVSVRYETSDAEYAWLNRIVAVASAVRLAHQVVYDAYVLR
jgi:hypothetical protein